MIQYKLTAPPPWFFECLQLAHLYSWVDPPRATWGLWSLHLDTVPRHPWRSRPGQWQTGTCLNKTNIHHILVGSILFICMQKLSRRKHAKKKININMLLFLQHICTRNFHAETFLHSRHLLHTRKDNINILSLLTIVWYPITIHWLWHCSVTINTAPSVISTNNNCCYALIY